VLGEGKWLDSFAPVPAVSPIAMKNAGKVRERVRKKTGAVLPKPQACPAPK
jgi:hypothetical protein